MASLTSKEHDASINCQHSLVRTAQAKDLLGLADILTDSFHSSVGIMGWFTPLFRLGMYEDLRVRLRSASAHHTCLVAVAPLSPVQDEDFLVGTVEMTLRYPPVWERQVGQYLYISNLAVRQSCRRQGVAQKLLLACERKALEWGFKDIYLHVLENNEQAKQLYFKLGYRLHYIDPNWSFPVLNQPRRLFLHKQLA